MEDISKWLKGIFERKEEPLSELIKRYSPSIRRFILGIVKNDEDAKELTQETFLRFISHPQNFQEIDEMRNYLFQIAHNLSLTRITKASSRREQFYDELPERGVDENISKAIIKKEEREFVLNLLQLLPPQQRKVVILKIWEDLTFKDVAKIMSLSEGSVKAHYFFAMRKLREEVFKKEEKNGRN